MAEDLLKVLRELRGAGQFDEARQLIASLQQGRAPDAQLAALAWQHQPFWWQDLQARGVTLRRRGPDDVALVRRCWADAEFMARFNRMAVKLPADDGALRALLQREQIALPQESRSLHWTIHAAGTALGFVSLVDISLQHRRAEFLMGVLPSAADALVSTSRVAVTAAHRVLAFAAEQAGLERLNAHFYPDNTAALKAALHLGFEHEGILRRHVRLPDGSRCDLVVTGLLLDAAYFERHARLRRRLLVDGVSRSDPASTAGLALPQRNKAAPSGSV